MNNKKTMQIKMNELESDFRDEESEVAFFKNKESILEVIKLHKFGAKYKCYINM